MVSKDPRIEALIDKVRTMSAAGWDHERIIQHLRDAGVWKGDAIVALARGAGVPRPDASRIVHFSKAYEARRAIDEAWNNAFWDFIESDEFDTIMQSRPEDDAD